MTLDTRKQHLCFTRVGRRAARFACLLTVRGRKPDVAAPFIWLFIRTEMKTNERRIGFYRCTATNKRLSYEIHARNEKEKKTQTYVKWRSGER